jgi:hypothetical protein
MGQSSVRSFALVMAVLVAAAVLPEAAAAQVGRILGRVLDAETGRPLSGAQVAVQGTRLGSLAGVDGRYIILNVPAGEQTLVVSFIGYATKTVTGVQVSEGAAVALDVTLNSSAVAIAEITVSAERERGTVSRTLDEQRRAVGVVSAVGSEQIARSPDGDAAQAVQRVAGVTVRDGGSVFVRGLGERYTTTSLNGARMPSPDPERRVVPLDLFPTSLLQSVSTFKTFTPDLPGDFGGAQVNIATREFPTRRRITFSTSGGFNDGGTGQDVLVAPRMGREWLAMGAGARLAPASVATPAAVRGLTTDEAMRNAVQQLGFDVRPTIATGRPNSSLGFSIGGQDPLFGREIGYIGSLTYSLSQEVRDNEIRTNPILRDGVPQVLEQWEGSTGRTSATLGGMLNLSTMFGLNHRLSLNNTYTRTMDNEAREDVGYTDYFQVPARRSTIRYVERSIFSSQVRGEHSFAERNHLDWTLTGAGVRRAEPDRVDMVYVQFRDGTRTYWGMPIGDPEGLRRTFGDLTENNYTAAANFRRTMGRAERSWDLRFGGLYRYTDRDARNFQFSVIPQQLPAGANSLAPQEIFALAGSPDARFRIFGSNDAGSYLAREHLGAGYAMAEMPIGARMRLIGGARVESANLELDTELVGGQRSRIQRNDLDVLPSLVLNVALSDVQSLRFSATQTLARPEYRELSPFAYLEVIGGEITKGNEDLRRSLIRNFDAKWELYPSPSEVVSLGLFAKQFDRPIERVDVATGGPPQVTFVNSESAFNVGAEVEVRTGMGRFVPALEPFSVFGNVTVMNSEISLAEGISANTNASRPMIGQAPYVVNLGLNFAPRSDATATLLYNIAGRRIWAAGSVPFPDTYEEPRGLLDLSLRFPLPGAVSGRFDARNILDTPFVLQQGPVERLRYNSGRVFSFGLNWTPAS